jgi:aspartate carbamoyltransferase regulatory subunit
VLKVENRDLSEAELDVLSLIAPEATINIIRAYDVIEKKRVERPDRVVGVLACDNRECITNADEPVEARFEVLEEGVRCEYCGSIIREDLAAHLAI